MDLLAKPALRANAHEVADEKHADHKLGINRGAPGAAVMLFQCQTDKAEVERRINLPQQMIESNMPLETEIVEKLPLPPPAVPSSPCSRCKSSCIDGITVRKRSQARVFHHYRSFSGQFARAATSPLATSIMSLARSRGRFFICQPPIACAPHWSIQGRRVVPRCIREISAACGVPPG